MNELLRFFEAELENPNFSDEDARIEFYTLTRGMKQEVNEAMFHLLEQHRPVVARKVSEELENI